MTGLPSIVDYRLPATGAELPRNVAQWSPEPDRAVLLVHDMQRYFLDALPSRLRAEVVRNASLVRERCAAVGVPVAYTAQPGRMTDQQRGLLRDFWGAGMRSDSADRQVIPELAPGPQDWLLTKWRYSAFFRSGLLERMRAVGRDQLVLCGVYGHVGVVATAMEAFTNDIRAFVIADAVADFSAEYHRLALEYVAQRCGQVVLTEEVFA
jgi:isochorismate hydrolase